MNNLPLNIVMQAKGGAGKTVTAFIFAQYLRDCLGQENCAFVDIDFLHGSFSRFKSLDVAYVNTTVVNEYTKEAMTDGTIINAVFEAMINIPQAILMDTASSNYIALTSYLEVNDVLEIFHEEDEIKRDVIIHVPLNGGSDFSFCVQELNVLFETFKNAKFVVWLNNYGGKLDRQDFKETKIARQLERSGRFLGSVVVPTLEQNQKDIFNLMLLKKLIFDEVELDSCINTSVLKKRQIKKLQEYFYSQLDDIFPQYAKQRAEKVKGTHMVKVGIIMGSNSDWNVMENAAKILEQFGVAYEAKVVSAHRTPDLMFEYAKSAQGRGLQAIIAGAGGAAHLPGMVASQTTLPVLGVPVPSKYLRGEDSLLSIVQMPKGVPVATFAIGEAGAANAALFAVSLLANQDAELAQKLADFRAAQTQTVLEMTLPDVVV